MVKNVKHIMKLETSGDVLRVSAIKELGSANAGAFRDWVRESLADGLSSIEVDLSETTFLDSSGLGALVSLHKAASKRQGTLRLLNANPSLRQILDLTRLSRVFEVVNS
jgi:anti-sigma B factor antagonist